MDLPKVVWMPGGLRTEIHLGGAETDGGACLLVDQPPPGWTLPPHRHRNEGETIHIVEGEFEMEVDGSVSSLGPGETIHIPRGTVHASSNVGKRTGRRIVLFTPAGIEGFFLEVGAERPDAEIDLTAAVDSAGRFGWEFPAPERT